jgi:hypothetical protein
MFARKIGDGSKDSSQQVMGAISNCIGFFHLRPFVPPANAKPPAPIAPANNVVGAMAWALPVRAGVPPARALPRREGPGAGGEGVIREG